MDNKTAERIAKLETKVEAIEEVQKSWGTLFKGTIVKIISSLLAIGGAGIVFGWHLPENVRKSLADWIQR